MNSRTDRASSPAPSPPARSSQVAVGEVAPDFTLLDQRGQRVTLGDLLHERTVVLYFYPKDDTPGCTAEACSFRDHYEVLKAAGAEVVGVSSDDVQAHEAFVARYNLPFILLSDPGGLVRASYGVKRSLGLIDGRVTFVIDREGVVRMAFSSQIRPKKHVDEALRIVRSLER
jgi:peroxiredoxin Q/BCP